MWITAPDTLPERDVILQDVLWQCCFYGSRLDQLGNVIGACMDKDCLKVCNLDLTEEHVVVDLTNCVSSMDANVCVLGLDVFWDGVRYDESESGTWNRKRQLCRSLWGKAPNKAPTMLNELYCDFCDFWDHVLCYYDPLVKGEVQVSHVSLTRPVPLYFN